MITMTLYKLYDVFEIIEIYRGKIVPHSRLKLKAEVQFLEMIYCVELSLEDYSTHLDSSKLNLKANNVNSSSL